jgi:hypothetical protein
VATTIFASVARADGALDAQQASRIDRARRLRRTGIGLTTAGLVCEAATLILWGVAADMINSSHSQFGEYGPDPAGYWPVFGFALGTAVAAPLLLADGIPLWSIGSHRLGSAPKTLSSTGVIQF